MKLRHLITGFFAGEQDPLLDGRSETEGYAYALSKCENWIAMAEGPLVKRTGFEFICAAGASAAWLIPFRRSVTQEYAVELGELTARFYTNGGRIETSPGVAYEIVTPYSAIEAPELWFQQSFDRLYIDHPAHAPGALRRDDAVTFAHETTTLVDGPFADFNSDDSKTVTLSGTLTKGGTATVSGAAGFTAGHVGAPFTIEAQDFSTLKAWEPQMKAVAIGDVVRSDGKAYQAATAGNTGSVQPTHTKGSEWDGLATNDVLNDKGPYGVKWAYLYDTFGIGTISAVASSSEATIEVTRTFPASLASVGSHRWAHGAFSEAAGWPSLCALWKGRLYHFKDGEIVASVVGDYGGGRTNFATYTDSGALAADLSFRRSLGLEDAPTWVARDRKLILGTPTRELAIGPINAGEAVSGSNIQAEDQSFYGGEPVCPVQAGTETIFVELGGRRLRAADFDFARDRYDARDLTAAARHVSDSGIVQLAHQRTPFSLLHAVRGDGQIALHARSRIEVKGFARTVLGGAARAKSAVCVFAADGKTSELWILAERENAAGDTVREIWKQTPWRELGTAQAEQFYVDGGTRVEATGGQAHFSGFTHLAGHPVAVLANGAVVPNLSIAADGTLDLPAEFVPKAAYVLIVGLAYTAEAVTLRPPLQANGASIQGMLQTVKRVATRLLETALLKVGVPGGVTEQLIDRNASDRMDAPIPLASGDYGGPVEAETDREGRARWISDTPTAAIVTAAMLNLDVDTKDEG
jgi:hypothetical protein